MKGRRGRYGTNQELDYEDEYSAETGLLQLFDYYSYFIVDQRSPAYTQLSGGSTAKKKGAFKMCRVYRTVSAWYRKILWRWEPTSVSMMRLSRY